MGLFGNNKDLQFRTCNLWWSTGKSREQKRGTFFYREEGVGRGYYKPRVHWRKLGVQSVMAFHWLSCVTVSHWLGSWRARRNCSFLLLGSKVSTFFLLEIQRYISSYWEIQRYISSYWVCNWHLWVGRERSLFWYPDLLKMRVLFINFHTPLWC